MSKKKWKKPKIEHNKLTKYNWLVGHPEGLYLGNNVDIGAFTYINAKYGVIIGDNVQIGGGCHIYSHNSINNITGKILIRMGAKIGAHCIILPNVIIKRNEIIKAGSIVYIRNGERLRKTNDNWVNDGQKSF